jgi:hypothetical protein
VADAVTDQGRPQVQRDAEKTTKRKIREEKEAARGRRKRNEPRAGNKMRDRQIA